MVRLPEHFQDNKMISRQQKRLRERELVRKSMTKAERRVWVRMRNPLKREIFQETLRMILDQFVHNMQRQLSQK